MARAVYFVVDVDGFLVGSGVMERGDWTKADLLAHLRGVHAGLTLVDVEDPAAPVRPARRPNPAAPKIARVEALRAKGWAQLTLAERAEVRTLTFDLGGPPPTA